tara:strand:- start:250 stop:420 length:171 start_codon:yes stop_codon:yes gene_type:complete
MCRLRIQKLKIGRLGDFEKIEFENFTLQGYRGILAQNTPKSDFRGPKIPPRGASST